MFDYKHSSFSPVCCRDHHCRDSLKLIFCVYKEIMYYTFHRGSLDIPRGKGGPWGLITESLNFHLLGMNTGSFFLVWEVVWSLRNWNSCYRYLWNVVSLVCVDWGFARQPRYIAGTIASFSTRKKIIFFLMLNIFIVPAMRHDSCANLYRYENFRVDRDNIFKYGVKVVIKTKSHFLLRYLIFYHKNKRKWASMCIVAVHVLMTVPLNVEWMAGIKFSEVWTLK